ncbi:MAG: histidine kinase [Bacteroidales bacterium]|nr:histidine kinase [Bacteroidales bacterium]
MLITLVIASFICVFLIDPGYRNIINQDQKISVSEEKSNYYHDIDSDGFTERMMCYRPSSNTSSVIVYSHTGGIINQHNFRGIFVEKTDLFFTDYDSDGLKEMCLFTHCADSLFINVFEPAAEYENHDITTFVDIAELQDGEAKYRISGGPEEDVNGDGINEIYFVVSAGFRIQPRNVYYFDIHGNEIRKSPRSGSGISYELNADDIDGDTFIELWGPVSAPGNIKTNNIQYTDQKAWLMVFNHLLNFEFDPVPFAEHPATIFPRLIKTGTSKKLVVKLHYKGTSESCCDRLMVYSHTGEKINDKQASELGINSADNIFIIGTNILLHSIDEGILLKLDTNLTRLASYSSELLKGNIYGPFDLDKNGKTEFISYTDYSLHFIDSRGRRTASTILTNSGYLTADPVIMNNYKGFSGIYLEASENNYLLTIESRNKWLIYSIKAIISFLLVYILVFLIQYIQVRQERKKQLTEKTLREYQLIAIKKQVNPHFIFNALTSISAMNFKNRREEADNYLVKFSHLMREVVESSDKNIVSLEDELTFIKKYLEVESIRIGPSLKYNIDIPAEFKNIKVPSMSFHIFTENAIKHGFASKKGEKKLDIRAYQQDGLLNIEIKDNGSGYQSGSTENKSTGKGLGVVEQMFNSYRKLTGKRINYSISSGKNEGTLIEIKISL